MQLGMVGLGRMGANLSRRLMRAGHEVVAFDLDAEAVARLARDGAVAVAGLDARDRATAAAPAPRKRHAPSPAPAIRPARWRPAHGQSTPPPDPA
jgi:6-phosphogluconate dehydrogenase (decarboxylating)